MGGSATPSPAKVSGKRKQPEVVEDDELVLQGTRSSKHSDHDPTPEPEPEPIPQAKRPKMLPKRIPTPEPKPKPKPKGAPEDEPKGGLEGGHMIGEIATQAIDLPPKRRGRPPNPTHTHISRCILLMSILTGY
ncbi:hypothetical protein ACGC1H_001999 [Rhizoctonia solani]